MMFSSYSVVPPAKSPETIITTQQLPPQHQPLQPQYIPQSSYNNSLLTPPHPASLPSSPESYIYSEVYSPLSNDDNDLLGVITSDSDETSLPIDFGNVDQFSFETGKNWVTDNYTTGICLLVILFSFGLFFNGLLFEGISVMVSPSEAISTTTTSRTLFGTKVVDDISSEELEEEMRISDTPGCIETNSNCNAESEQLDGVKKKNNNNTDQLLETDDKYSIYTISPYL